jgi:hypothetical protein
VVRLGQLGQMYEYFQQTWYKQLLINGGTGNNVYSLA